MMKKIISTLKKGCKFYYFFPLIIALCIFKLIPFISAVITSFKQQYNFLTGNYKELGFDNYTKIFNDEFFIQALSNTAIYVVFVVILVIIIALPIAWCLFRVKRGSAFFQTAIFLPFVTSDIAVGLAWRLMFNDKGIINFLLGTNIGWLTDANMSLVTLILFGIWSGLPLAILLYLCAMLNLDNNIINAARADGASDTKIFFKTFLVLLNRKGTSSSSEMPRDYRYGDYLLRVKKISQEEYDEGQKKAALMIDEFKNKKRTKKNVQK